MRELYGRARNVFAWVGKEDEFTSDAMTVMERLSSVPKDLYELVSSNDFYDPESFTSKLAISLPSQSNWLGWLAFLHRPYFKRAWVVQEVALAGDVTVLCGKAIFPWANFSATLQFIAQTKWNSHLHPENMRLKVVEGDPTIYQKLLSENIDPGYSAMYLEQTKRGMAVAGKPWTLEQLLLNHRHCESSDPRDRIYAFLGMARKDRPPFTTHASFLIPDYRLPVQKVYTRVAKSFMQSYGDLRVLSHVQAQSLTQTEGLPSFVPDYSVRPFPDPLFLRSKNCNWCAAAGLEWKRDMRVIDDELLDVQGMMVGDIIEASEVSAAEGDALDNYWTSVATIAAGVGDYYAVSQERLAIPIFGMACILSQRFMCSQCL
jgi:hypothetical protein